MVFCTGQEPYSIAMMLHETLGDIFAWDVSIVAIDRNAPVTDSWDGFRISISLRSSAGRWRFRFHRFNLFKRRNTPEPEARFASERGNQLA